MKTYNQVPEEKNEIILSYLKKKIKKYGLNLKDVSKILDINYSTFWRYFNGKSEMPLITYFDICSLLKIDPIKPIKKAFR